MLFSRVHIQQHIICIFSRVPSLTQHGYGLKEHLMHYMIELCNRFCKNETS